MGGAPDLIGGYEIITTAGSEPLLAFPRGRHHALRVRPPRVTVCVPLHQGSRFLDRAVESVMGQSFQDVALMIIDDGSRDDGFAMACRFADRHEHVLAFQNPRNLGRAATFNRCLAVAVGEYVKLLPATDYLLPAFLQTLVDVMDADPDLVLARSSVATLEHGQITDVPYFSSSRALTGTSALIHALTGNNLAAGPGAQLMRRAAIEGYHLRFRDDLGWGASLELSMRLLGRGDFAYERQPLYVRDEEARRGLRPDAADVFSDECEARLSALRDLPTDLVHGLGPSALVRTVERITALYHEAARGQRADETEPGALERTYGRTLEELLLHLRRATGAPEGDVPRTGDVARPALANLMAQADADTQAQRYQAAEVPIRRILASQPWNLDALNGLGVLRYHQADLAGARKYLSSVLEFDPANPLARENLDLLSGA